MQLALEPEAAAPPGSQGSFAWTSAARWSLLLASAALVFCSVFFGGGASDGRLLWIGGAAALVALAAWVAAAFGALPWPAPTRAGAACLALGAGFVLWSGVSMAWSITPDRSWSSFNRGLVYLAFALVGLFAGALGPRALRPAAAGLAVLLALALGWALLGKIAPSLFPDGARVARLRAPVGYWNALALLGDVALPLGLWLSAPGWRRHWRRALGVVLVYGAIVAVLLTYSRAGVAVGAIAVALWLLVGGAPFEGLVALILAAPVALGVSAFAFTRPGIVDDGQPYAVRASDGGWFGLVLGAGALVVVALVLVVSRWEERRPVLADRRRLLARAAGAGIVLVVAVALLVSALAGRGPGAWVREFENPPSAQVTQAPGRLTTISSNNRWAWWQEAWTLFTRRPLEGHGAGSFEVARRPIRVNEIVTTEPHSVPLQFMSDTGIVGFLLAATAAAAGLLAVARLLRRLEGPERAAGAALAVAVPAYLLHAVVDIDWDFLAVTAPAALVVGLLLGAGRPARPARGRTLVTLGAAVAVSALVYSLTAPWLSARRVDDAYAALGRGDYPAAVAAARDARSLDPLSPDPLFAWAAAEDAAGNPTAALRLYESAAILQPHNWITWYSLGAFEFQIGHFKRAYRDLDWSYGLDPHGTPGSPGGLLDQVRARLARS